jgi:hypothetical protein
MGQVKFKLSKAAKPQLTAFQDKIMPYRLSILASLITVFLLLLLLRDVPASAQQPLITNTAVDVSFPDASPTSANLGNSFIEATPSPTFTPTPEPPNVYAEADPDVAIGDTLVRDFPESGAVIGVLQSGVQYPVYGQYFSWILIEYETAPNQRAWVYYETVRLFGDIGSIPYVAENAAQPFQRSAEDIATETAIVLFQTPGYAETATASSRIIVIEETVIPTVGDLPTYTPPAEINQRLPTLDANALPTATPQAAEVVGTALETFASGNIPPIAPILSLLVFGSLGLLISRLRR